MTTVSVLRHEYPETEFSDVIGTKVLRVFLLAIHSHLYLQILLPPPPLSKSSLKLVYNANIVYGNLKSANSPDCAQKPQRKLYIHEFSFWALQLSPIAHPQQIPL